MTSTTVAPKRRTTQKLTAVAAGTVALTAGLGLAAASPADAATHSQAVVRSTSVRTTPVRYRATTYRTPTTRSYSFWTSSRSTSTSTTSSSSSSSSATTTSSSSTSTSSSTTSTATVSTTGSCPAGSAANGTTCNKAIAFMLAQKNSGSTAWHNRCLGLVSQAYGGAYAGYSTAAAAAAAVKAAGLMHTTTDLASIPRGAVVWFGNSGAGHVVISLGNGLAISSDVANGTIGSGSGGVGVVQLSYFVQSWNQTLIGWSSPRV